MDETSVLGLFDSRTMLAETMAVNDKTAGFGLMLSEKDAKHLLECRWDTLKERGRVEFGKGILPKLVETFCDSPFIYQENYVNTIERLQDIFYEYKNESADALSDDELLELMEKEFDGICQGSLEYLEETILDSAARNIRIKKKGFSQSGYTGETVYSVPYSMEELVTLTAALAVRYTSGESTSVSYSTADRLMGAVLYCIDEAVNNDKSLPAGAGRISAETAYQIGYERVCRKAEAAQEKYNQMIVSFMDYGNENYRDTVTKALPGFFRFYDPEFAPQDTIITMDYPVLNYNASLKGINAIEAYLDAVCMEQQFLKALPEEYVCRILFQYRADYRKHFFNISSIILRHILGNAVIGKKVGTPAEDTHYVQLAEWVHENSHAERQKALCCLLERLTVTKFENGAALYDYFRNDLDGFNIQMENTTEFQNLKNVLVL